MTISPEPSSYEIQSSDTLDRISDSLLGDFRNWRELATINGIDIFSATDFQPGKLLQIPTVDQVRQLVSDALSQGSIEQVRSQLSGIDYDILDLTPLKEANLSGANPWQLVEWLI